MAWEWQQVPWRPYPCKSLRADESWLCLPCPGNWQQVGGTQSPNSQTDQAGHRWEKAAAIANHSLSSHWSSEVHFGPQNEGTSLPHPLTPKLQFWLLRNQRFLFLDALWGSMLPPARLLQGPRDDYLGRPDWTGVETTWPEVSPVLPFSHSVLSDKSNKSPLV